VKNVCEKIKLNQEEKLVENKKNNIIPSEYGCEILLEKTTLEKVKDKSFPTDARIITYIVDNETFIDLTRCRKVVNLFDMYYDKYGSGSIQGIDFGYGTVNPKMWGYKPPEKRKKR
jgi:hypothetical protein